MAKSLDFNSVPKKYLTVTLADEKKTTLMIGTPTKAIMGELLLLQGSVEAMQDDADIESMDGLYNATAKIMSRNKAGIPITKEYLEDILDFEDLIIFFQAYMSFVEEISKTKN